MNNKRHFIAVVSAVILCAPIWCVEAHGQLTLRVTVDTGFTEITNNGSSELAIDGYSISSPTGQLGGTWSSLMSQGLPGWDEADNADDRRRTEFNPTSAANLPAGDSLSLGSVYQPISNVSPDVSFQYTQPNGTTDIGIVDISTALRLNVDRSSGEVTLSNGSGGVIDIDGYSVTSTSGALGDGWQSFQNQSVAGWDEADNSDAFRVTEFNPLGATSIAGNELISLGQLYQPTPPSAIGQDLPEDLTFEYTSPTGKTLVGDVGFSGALNNVVMTIDPATGMATMQNQSPFFDTAIDAYSITSSAGTLDVNGWNSLESQGVANWDAADNVDAFRLTEFNPTSETPLAGGGTILDLGQAFDVTNGIDLDVISFSYLVAGGGEATGLIRLASAEVGCAIPAGGIGGDLDGNGQVAFADFLVLSNNFGQDVSTYQEGDIDCSGDVGFADFLVLSTNFGQSAVEASSVPEPRSIHLLCFGLLGLLMRKHRR